jgi:hypothetical protein
MTNQPNWTMRAKDGGAIARPPETMRPQILPTMRVLRNGTECIINQSDFNSDTDEKLLDKKKPAMKAAEPAPLKASKRPSRRKV